MKIRAIVFFLVVVFAACTSNKSSSSNADATINHLVFLQLKEQMTSADSLFFIEQINRLKNIDTAIEFEVSYRKSTGDKRALADFDFIISTKHKDSESLKLYKTNPVHLEVISLTKKFMAGPPKTFDY